MQKIQLQNTDLNLANICLGSGNFGEKLSEEEAFAVMDSYVEKGGNFFDTANVYCRWVPGKDNCSEEIIGKWLKSRNAYNKVVIATKGAHYDLANSTKPRVNKKEVTVDLESSLKTLGLDQIELYWLHRDDENKPIEEIMDMMEEFVKEGKIRYYGASNFKLERMDKAVEYAKKRGHQGFFAVSNQWSLATVNPGKNVNPDTTMEMMTEEYYKWHKENKMPMIPYSSSAFGFFEKLHKEGDKVSDGKLLVPVEEIQISDKIKSAYINQKNLSLYNRLEKLQEKYQVSMFALSVAALINQPFNVIPIISVTKPEQVEDFVSASNIKLEPEELFY